MCLAVPAQVISHRDDQLAIVDLQGSRMEVSLALLPELELGAWVLIHAGYAIQHLDEEEARETWRYLKEAELVDELPPEFQEEGV